MRDDTLKTQLFEGARTFHAWLKKPVSDDTLRQLYDLMKWGPTSANSSPARLVFVSSPQAKEKLLACLMDGNKEQTKSAPVTAVLAWDTQFYDLMTRLYPANPAFGALFASSPDLAHATAFRNASLQGGYFILAARALGLDCGPMSGFDNDALDKAFFPDGQFKSNFLCNLGHGAPEGLHPRGPRLAFDEACQIL